MRRFLFAAVLCVATQIYAAKVNPFSLPWMNQTEPGNMFNSADYSSGIYVVEAYFLTCTYCNNNAPQLDEVSQLFSDEWRVHVLDVGVDRTDPEYQDWIDRHHPNHPVLKDAQRKLIQQLGTSGFPSTYVLDCKGNVRFSTSGEWGDEEKRGVISAVRRLLDEYCKITETQ